MGGDVPHAKPLLLRLGLARAHADGFSPLIRRPHEPSIPAMHRHQPTMVPIPLDSIYGTDTIAATRKSLRRKAMEEGTGPLPRTALVTGAAGGSPLGRHRSGGQRMLAGTRRHRCQGTTGGCRNVPRAWGGRQGSLHRPDDGGRGTLGRRVCDRGIRTPRHPHQQCGLRHDRDIPGYDGRRMGPNLEPERQGCRPRLCRCGNAHEGAPQRAHHESHLARGTHGAAELRGIRREQGSG